jgi:hypothetical protein
MSDKGTFTGKPPYLLSRLVGSHEMHCPLRVLPSESIPLELGVVHLSIALLKLSYCQQAKKCETPGLFLRAACLLLPPFTSASHIWPSLKPSISTRSCIVSPRRPFRALPDEATHSFLVLRRSHCQKCECPLQNRPLRMWIELSYRLEILTPCTIVCRSF